MKSNKAFTLIELLVVVLIIGILAAIAVPQYKKAVLKANLHKGIPLVESLYEAQQAYALTHGNFATDIDALDVSIPKTNTCIKTQNTSESKYTKCGFGTIGIYDKLSNIQYIVPSNIAYVHFFKDYNKSPMTFSAGEIWCFAKPTKSIAQKICQDIGGIEVYQNSSWIYYRIK